MRFDTKSGFGLLLLTGSCLAVIIVGAEFLEKFGPIYEISVELTASIIILSLFLRNWRRKHQWARFQYQVEMTFAGPESGKYPLDESKAYVMRLDTQFRVVEINDLYRKHLRQEGKDILGRNFLKILPAEEADRVRSNLESLTAERPWVVTEIHPRKLKDTFALYRWSDRAIFDDDGERLGYISIGYEITDRGLAQTEIENLKAAARWASSALVLTDLSFKITWCNEAFVHQTGYALEELKRQSPFALSLQTLEHKRKAVEMNRALQKGEAFRGEFQLVRRDRKARWFFVEARPLRSADGALQAYLGTGIDMHELHEARELTAHNERVFRALFEAGSSMKVLFDGHTGAFLDVNQTACSFYGFTREEMLQKTIFDLGNLSETQDNENLAKIRAGIFEDFESQHLNAQGELRDVLVSNAPVPDLEGNYVLSIVTDITAAKEQARQQQQLTDRLTIATQGSGVGVWEWNVQTGEVVWDAQMRKLYQWPVSKAAPRWDQWIRLLDPEDRRRLLKLGSLNFEGQDRGAQDFRLRLPDGSRSLYHAEAMITRDADGQTERLIGINYDRTEEVAAAQQIVEQAERLDVFLSAAQVGTFDWDVVSGDVRFDEVWFQLLGLDPEKAPHAFETWEDRLHPEDRAHALSTMEHLLETHNNRFDLEHRMQHVDGTWRWFLGAGGVVKRDAQGNATRVIGIQMDITTRKETEARLATAAEEWQRTFDAVPDLICILDIDHRIMRMNKAFAEKTDMHPYHSCGEMAECVLFGGECPQADCPHAQALQMGTPSSVDVCRPYFGGQYSISVTPIFDPEGEVIASVHVARNIEKEQAALEEVARQRQFLRQVIDTFDAYIFVRDRGGFYRLVNDRMAKLVDAEPQDVEGHHLSDFLPPTDDRADSFLAEDLEVIESAEPYFKDTQRTLLPDGRWVYLSVQKTPIFDHEDKAWGLMGFAYDVTERVEREEELRLAKDAAEAANRAKSEFVALMSHELRTPLNPIIGWSELLEQTTESPQNREGLRVIHRSGEHLLSLINGILRLSQLEASSLSVERAPVSLEELNRNVLQLYRPKAQEKGLELQAISQNLPHRVLLDETFVSEILQNLVSNALKFTHTGRIELRCSWDHATERVSYAVSDSGMGIEPKHQEAIWEAFQQADPSDTRVHGGTGLGLTICQRLVRLMGGEISLESTPEQGTTFRFYLPSSLAEPAAPAPEASHPPKQTGSDILIVEDDADNLRVLAQMCEVLGHTVTTFARGTLAVEACAERRFNLIFLDLQMPEMDGFTVAEKIRTSPHNAKTPIIALTALSGESVGQRILEVGMQAHVVKPVGLKHLREILQEFIEKS